MEFMFRKDICIDLFRKMILSDDVGDRKECLAKMLPMHQLEFQNIFRVMDNRQVVIRMLDPPRVTDSQQLDQLYPQYED